MFVRIFAVDFSSSGRLSANHNSKYFSPNGLWIHAVNVRRDPLRLIHFLLLWQSNVAMSRHAESTVNLTVDVWIDATRKFRNFYPIFYAEILCRIHNQFESVADVNKCEWYCYASLRMAILNVKVSVYKQIIGSFSVITAYTYYERADN